MLLLATGLSVLRLSTGDVVREAVERFAAHVARQLDAIGRIEGELAMRVGREGTFLSLPPTLGGASYRLEIRATRVLVAADGLAAAESLRVPVHPFRPDRASYSHEELAAIVEPVVVPGGGEFLIARTLREVAGMPVYLTFAWLPS